MKKILSVLTFLIVGGLLSGLVLYADYRAFLDERLTVPDQGIEFNVSPGASIGAIAAELKAQGVLRSAVYLRAYARLHGLASQIKTGEYLIAPGSTPRTLMEKLVAGRVIQYALTIVEGWTFRQMLDAIHSHDKLEPTLKGLDDAEIMARLGHPGEHPEGRFFPDTYHFPRGTSDLDFLRRAYDTMEKKLREVWEQRTPDLPLDSPYQALILASIIEKETGLAGERREIAGVFVRRLRKGMLLQTDPTVIYGAGSNFDGDLRRKDLETDTPYNTYVRKGLPPTPICLPGAESLAAAVDPASGDALYFVARGDGSHVFTKTLSEHNRAVQEYQLNNRH